VLYPVAVGVLEENADAPPALPGALTRTAPIFDPRIVRVLPQAGRIEGPFPALASSAAAVGHIAAWPDVDGVYRRVPTFVRAGERALPALGVAMAASFLQVSFDQVDLVPGDALRFRGARLPDGRPRSISVPVDAEGRLLIRYAGRWTDSPFPYLSFVDVWDAIAEGRESELREQVAGKLVIVVHAALGSDKRRTPVDVSVPGGFILANVANTILTQQGLREVSSSIGWVLTLGLGLAATGAMIFLPGWGGPVAVSALGLVYAVIAFVSMGLAGLVLPVVPPLATLSVSSVLSLGWMRRYAADRVSQLENELLVVHRALATKQLLLAQQEGRADQLQEDIIAARTEVESWADRRMSLEQTIASLQQRLHVAQQEVDETRLSVKGLEDTLASMQSAKLIRGVLATDEQEKLRVECGRYGIVTRDPVVLRCWKDVKRAARSETPIMILGEAGTGKELFAQATHSFSERASQPFVPVNMAAVPPDLFESELFGHLRGSFTGAVRDHEGYFLQAHKGTIFLDEIGDLRPDLQAKLLRVLQEGIVTRVGDRKPTPVDVRVVSATNRDLLKGIAEGWFREDLYYRLHGIELRLPPLRKRQGDIQELAQRFIEQRLLKESRMPVSLSQGALDRLIRWPWKGNVRELKRCIENAIILAEGPVILEQDLRLSGVAAEISAVSNPEISSSVSSDGDDDPKKSDRALLQLLRDHSFDLQATAATLGWDRSTVMQRLKGMCFQALVQYKGDKRAAASSLAGDPGLTRLVEVRLKEYVEHLKKVVATFPSQETALAGCRKRFKNLPERYSVAVETLIRRQAAATTDPSGTSD
jgi:transcriptional regulator with PAS, ATPase and Fis domain/CHASE2 domain-containing sensor protein